MAFPDFLKRGTSEERLCAAFFTESQMQFGSTTKLDRKSGFGLHQLRNRCSISRHNRILVAKHIYTECQKVDAGETKVSPVR
jgi:hypothetical protein